MKLLRITLADTGETEYLNLERIISIKPHGERVKILMGAGLYWWATAESLAVVDLASVNRYFYETIHEITNEEIETR